MAFIKGLVRTDSGVMFDKGNRYLDPRHPNFGKRGARCDGEFDDFLAWRDCLDMAEETGLAVCVPPLPSLVTQPLLIASRVDMFGDGIYSAIIVDIGTDTDAVVVSAGEADGSYIWSLRWRDFAILGGANCARNMVVFDRCHNGDVDLIVRGGAAQFGTVVKGCISPSFRIRTSVNFAHPYIESSLDTMPAGGVLLKVVEEALADMPVNASKFDVILEGIQQKGSDVENRGHGFYAEDQTGSGGNLEIRGTIEGCEGKGYYLEGCTNPKLSHLHCEANALANEIKDCRTPRVGPGYLDLSGPVLTITGTTLGAKLDGMIVSGIEIGEDCRRTELGQIQYGSDGTSTITDLSGEAIVLGPIIGPNDNDVAHLAAGGPADHTPLAEGGTFEYWPTGDSAAPLNWGFVGSAPTWVRTGDAFVDTRRNFTRNAVKVTVAASTEGPALSLDLTTSKGRWVTCAAWVYLPTGTAPTRVRTDLWIDGSTVRAGPYTDTKDGWARLQFTGFVPANAATSVQLVFRGLTALNAAMAGVFYIADVSAYPGTVGVQTYAPPPNARENFYVNGTLFTSSDGIPTTGSYKVGALVINRGSGTTVGWKRLTTGSGHVLDTDWHAF